MRIIDRYILKSVVTVFLSCIFIFLFLYVIIDILGRLEDILLRHQFNIPFMVQYYLSNLPIMFVQVAPFAGLLATLTTFGKLNHGNEIIAMRSSGLSIMQISKNVIIMGFIVSLFTFWVSDRLVPSSSAIILKMKDQMEHEKKGQKDKKPEVIINLSMYGMKNRLFFINRYNIPTNTMDGITILEHDEHQNLIRKIVANKGVYEDKLWKFSQCITYNFDKNGQILLEPLYSEEEIMSIPEGPNDFLTQMQRIDSMSIAQLEDYIWKLSRSGANSVIRNLKIDLYQRFISPFTSMFIMLLGIPFSLMMRKRATGLSSIGISIMGGFLYYIIDAVCIALGKGGMLTPLLSASLSHIIILLLSIQLISHMP